MTNAASSTANRSTGHVDGFSPAPIAYAAGLLPILAVVVAYALSLAADLVPACVPFIEGCTSISRASRQGWASHWFKATMLPAAALLLLFWWLAATWLRLVNGGARRRRSWMLWLGVIGALFLILYATFLGVEGKTYQWLRRYGVTVYFSFTVLAQMLLVSAILKVESCRRHRHVIEGLCGLMLLLGLASLPLQHFLDHPDAAVNAIEWCYALLMTSVFPVVGLAWRRTGFLFRPGLREGPVSA